MHGEASARILALLSDAELSHLKVKQTHYLNQVLSPNLSREEHMFMAKKAGLRHTWIGLPPDILAQSFQVYRGALEDMLDPDLSNRAILHAIIIERLSNDLSWQLMAYTEAEQERARAIEDIGQIFSLTLNREDLLRRVLQRIVEISGIAGAEVMAMQQEHGICCEICVGKTLHEGQTHLTAQGCAGGEDGLVMKAWQSEEPVRIDCIAQTSSLAAYASQAKTIDLRSLAICPVLTTTGAPQILLILYSPWPGYFHASWQHNFWGSVKRQLGIHLVALEKIRPAMANDTLSFQDRRRYRQLLQEDGLKMWYQPVVDPASHRIVKAEALARLQDGDRIVSPYFFLPAFGSVQLLTLLEKGLQQIVKDAQQFAADGSFPLIFSINLPPEVFQNPGFLQHLVDWGHTHLSQQAQITESGSMSITLEILETGILDESTAQEQISLLRRAGFRIALDDVGSGESSLSRFRSLPIDEIKIDQSFIRALEKNPDAIDFVLILADIADDLNLACVAEGVENAAIADMLASIGRIALQGYAYAKPMPAVDLADWAKGYQLVQEPAHPCTLHGWYAQWIAQSRIIRAALMRMPQLLDIIDIDDDIHSGFWDVPENTPLTDDSRCQIIMAYNDYRQAVNIAAGRAAMKRPRDESFAPLNIAEEALKLVVRQALSLRH